MRSEPRSIRWWLSLSSLVVAANVVAVAQTPSRVLLVLLNNANQLGIVDPVAGKVLGTVSVGEDPHGVAASADGKFAFTANANSNTISVIDLAARKEVRRVELGPDSHPHDILVAGGKVYFTLEGYKAVGRYDPAAKTWKTWSLPKSGSGAYAVYVDDKDRVWLTDFTANAIVRFDPSSEAFESFPSNKRGASVRQLLGRPGEVWGGESGADRLVVVRD